MKNLLEAIGSALEQLCECEGSNVVVGTVKIDDNGKVSVNINRDNACQGEKKDENVPCEKAACDCKCGKVIADETNTCDNCDHKCSNSENETPRVINFENDANVDTKPEAEAKTKGSWWRYEYEELWKKYTALEAKYKKLTKEYSRVSEAEYNELLQKCRGYEGIIRQIHDITHESNLVM